MGVVRGVTLPSPTDLRCRTCDKIRRTVTLTNERSRYLHLWTVIQRLEEMFVRYLDISHPVEQILRPAVVDCKLDELSSHSHVRRSFGHVEIVRYRFFKWPALV